MLTEETVTVSPEIDSRIAIAVIRQRIRGLVAMEVQARRDRQALKTRYHSDPEFRAEQSQPVYPGYGSYSHYDRKMGSCKPHSEELRTLYLVLAYLRGRAYSRCEPTSRIRKIVLAGGTSFGDDLRVISNVARELAVSETAIREWVKS